MITQTGQYALKAMVELARNHGDHYVLVKDISRELNIPRQYLSKVLHMLARKGLLVSQRGRQGGFRLSRSPSKISILEVLDPVEKLERYEQCILGNVNCSQSPPCPMHEVWADIRDRYLDFLKSTTLDRLA